MYSEGGVPNHVGPRAGVLLTQTRQRDGPGPPPSRPSVHLTRPGYEQEHPSAASTEIPEGSPLRIPGLIANKQASRFMWNGIYVRDNV